MLQFLDDAIDLLNRVGDGRGFVRGFLAVSLLVMALSLFMLPLLVVPLGTFFPLPGLFDGRWRRFFRRDAGCGIFAGRRRGQGTARFATPRMASASASGATPGSWGGRIRWCGG